MRIVWAVMDRELRAASRRPATWRLRLLTGTAGCLLTAGTFWFYGNLWGGAAAAGSTMFTTLGLMAGFWAMLAGCQRTADSIGRERRDGTLGLLFLTDQTGWTVVLGKLGAAGFEILYQLLAILPVMAIPVMLGGVSLLSVAYLLLALVNGLVLSLGLGLLGSLWAREPRQAVGIAASLLLGLSVFPWGLFSYLVNRENPLTPQAAFPVVLLSPLTPLAQLLPNLPVLPPIWMGLLAIGLQGLLTFAALAFTARRVRTVWQVGTGRGWRVRWHEFLDRIRYGGPEARVRHRTRLLGQGAWVWLSRRERWKHWLPWLLIGTLIALEWWLHWQIGMQWILGGLLASIPLTFHFLLRMWVAAEAAHTLAEQRSAGAMELLLTTPLGPLEILRQQFRGLVGLLGGPTLALLANDVFFLFLLGREGDASNSLMPWNLHLAALVSLPVHVFAVRWVATWQVVQGRPTNQAVGRAMGMAVLLPLVVGLFLCVSGLALLEQLAQLHQFETSYSFRLTLATWAWLAVQWAWGLWLGRRFATRVQQGFREAMSHLKGPIS